MCSAGGSNDRVRKGCVSQPSGADAPVTKACGNPFHTFIRAASCSARFWRGRAPPQGRAPQGGRRYSPAFPIRLLQAVREARRSCGRRFGSGRGAVEAVCPRLKGGGGQMTPERSSFRSCHFVMERPNNTQVAAPGQRGRGRGSLRLPVIDPSAGEHKGHFSLSRLRVMRRYSRGD